MKVKDIWLVENLRLIKGDIQSFGLLRSVLLVVCVSLLICLLAVSGGNMWIPIS